MTAPMTTLPPALILAAPASGSGKTTLTLGLLRALRNAGVAVAGAKAGPDYIDPAFHAAASGRAAYNLDPWAMRPETLAALLQDGNEGAALLLVEGVMGLFDGAAGGAGSTADLAAALGLPVVLVVDVRGQAQSVAALVEGFRRHRSDVAIAGLILNRVGGPGHAALLREALAPLGLPLLGLLPRRAALALPERHLGLVQAGEHAALERFLETAAAETAAAVDLAALRALARPPRLPAEPDPEPAIAPFGGRLAVARDAAFAFAYPHLLDAWRAGGVELSFFSPLADEAPDPAAESVWLPGGYPELHGGVLAAAGRFREGLRAAAARGALVYGECGGFMVLGESLTDAEGREHPMAGLLPLKTSFRERRLHLGYRRLVVSRPGPWGGFGAALRGHEFHYATVLWQGVGEPLFQVSDAAGRPLGPAGLAKGSVAGSFLHLVDRAG